MNPPNNHKDDAENAIHDANTSGTAPSAIKDYSHKDKEIIPHRPKRKAAE